MDGGEFLLATTLAVAVPLRIAELGDMTVARRWHTISQWADEAADAVAHHGDVLQYGGKPGQAAAVSNDLARGLAALAHSPGGTSAFGTLWCAAHYPQGLAAYARCPRCEDDEVWPADDDGPLPEYLFRHIDEIKPNGRYKDAL